MSQCRTCALRGQRGGVVLPPIEGCTWQIAPELGGPAAELLRVCAQLAAEKGMCPGYQAVDSGQMPNSYLSLDLPRECAQVRGTAVDGMATIGIGGGQC